MLDFRPNPIERQNDLALGLEERFYNALNYKEYLDNDKFHHSDKGCDVEIRRTLNGKEYDQNYAISKFCKTHNVMCSKTGWELGWYQGTHTKELAIEYTCPNCGKIFYSQSYSAKYCEDCRHEVKIRQCREHYHANKAHHL